MSLDRRSLRVKFGTDWMKDSYKWTAGSDSVSRNAFFFAVPLFRCSFVLVLGVYSCLFRMNIHTRFDNKENGKNKWFYYGMN